MAEVDLDSSRISAKIVILGEPAVGKTTLRHSFMGDKMTKDYSMTLGADIVITRIKIDDTTSLESQIWDLAGQETFKPLIRSFVQGAHGAIVAFDLTRPDTFEKVSEWLDFLHEANPHLGNNIPFLIVGNKADLEGFIKMDDEVVEDFMEYVNRLKVYSQTPTQYIKTSAKTGYKVNEAFRTLGMDIIENFRETGQEDILDKLIQTTAGAEASPPDSDVEESLGDLKQVPSVDTTTMDEDIADKKKSGVDPEASSLPITSTEEGWELSSDYDLDFPNPYDVVNTFIDLGLKLIDQEGNLDVLTLSSTIRTYYSLDTLLSTDLEEDHEFSLETYRDAIDRVRIIPSMYFEIKHEREKIGKTLIIKNIDKLARAMNLYHKYRDPRRRDPNLVQDEMLMDSILSQGKIQSNREKRKNISIDLSRIQTTSSGSLNTLSDIPTLQVERFLEDKRIFSQSITYVTFVQLREGKMVYPDMIRILNLIEPDILQDYLLNEPILQITRIISSVQRLADIIYASNFGFLDYALSSDIIEKMYANPIETRTNLPESDAKDLVTFLNNLADLSPRYAGIAKKVRKINYCAKPLSDENADLMMVDTTSEAIKQILSIIHYASELDEMEEQIEIILEMIRDPHFQDLTEHYLNPDFELLHAPLLSLLQAAIEMLETYLAVTSPTTSRFSHNDLVNISNVLNGVVDSMLVRPKSDELIEIWARLNGYLMDKIDFNMETKTLDQVYNLIRGKEMILNIMTPLLLAKYEGRGYNPLASIENEQLESKLKNITGIIAIGSNLSTENLEEFLKTMFVKAPEMKSGSKDQMNVSSRSPIPRVGIIGEPKERSESNLIPTAMGIGLTRIANEYVTGGGERNLYKAIMDLIKFTKQDKVKLDY